MLHIVVCMATKNDAKQGGEPQPMYVRLPVDLHEAVKARSVQEDRTMAQTVRVALRYYLQQTKPLAS
jgi:hypothetical protein